MLNYEYLSAEDDKPNFALPEGDYPFVVRALEDKPTKSGKNNMLVVEMDVYTPEGKAKRMRDWIVYDMPQMAWKFRHWCITLGLEAEYESRKFDEKLALNKHGVVSLKCEDYVNQNGDLSTQNVVKDYVKPGEAKGVAAPAKEPEPFLDEDIPL